MQMGRITFQKNQSGKDPKKTKLCKMYLEPSNESRAIDYDIHIVHEREVVAPPINGQLFHCYDNKG